MSANDFDLSPCDETLSQPFHIQLTGGLGAELQGDSQQFEAFLCEQPQVYFEGDGSFGWSGPGWSLYGMLYDRAGRLNYVELQGRCPQAVFRQLVAKMTPPGQPTQVTMLPEGGLYALQDFEDRTWHQPG